MQLSFAVILLGAALNAQASALPRPREVQHHGSSTSVAHTSTPSLIIDSSFSIPSSTYTSISSTKTVSYISDSWTFTNSPSSTDTFPTSISSTTSESYISDAWTWTETSSSEAEAPTGR
ncbi:hypothetical protein DL93DRAFT_1351129 [Clavulina sp. PMI_390]|nr:hypothetical protein DL93DRAFT_1351129 [Clavulina sp. PMI_390]